jgi:adenylate kinase
VLIIFLGPPGSGKGTQASIISSILSIPSLSTGVALNEFCNSGGELSEKLKSYIHAGQLVPSSLVNEVVVSALSRDEYRAGCILDGYPRTIDQAEFLDMQFPNLEQKIIYFDISYSDLANRISGRFVCAKCEAIYNKISSPTKIVGICDVCGSKEFKERKDDSLDVLQKRWEVYISQTEPLLEYYASKAALISIDATLKKEEITNKVMNKLKNR